MVGSGRGINAGWIVLEQRERHYLPSTFCRPHRRVGIVERPVLSDCHQARPGGGHAPHPLGTLTAEDHLVVGDPGPADPVGRGPLRRIPIAARRHRLDQGSMKCNPSLRPAYDTQVDRLAAGLDILHVVGYTEAHHAIEADELIASCTLVHHLIED